MHDQRQHDRQRLLVSLERDLRPLDPQARTATLAQVEEMMLQGGENPILLYSFLFAVSGSWEYGLALLERVRDPALPWPQRRRLYWQLYNAAFRRVDNALPQLHAALARWYLELHSEFLARLAGRMPTPSGPPGTTVVVLVNQFLQPVHAPSNDAIALIRTLLRLGRRPMLVNTADLPSEVSVDFFNPIVANRDARFDPIKVLDLDVDGQIPFLQCRSVTDDPDEACAVLTAVAAARPCLVLNLGHSSHLADACRPLAPVIAIPCTTEVPIAAGGATVLYGNPTPADQAVLDILGLGTDDWIKDNYAFRPPSRGAGLTRTELGLPEDDYLLAIVGTRLDDEMGPTDIAHLEQLLQRIPAVHVVIIGFWHGLPFVSATHPVWQSRCTRLGYRTDLVDILACCDGFYNPRRQGGGTSVAWALALGLQVFTADTGDGRYVAGPERVIADGQALAASVEAFRCDPAFRAACQEGSRLRFASLTDNEGLVRRVLAFGERLAARRAASG